MLSCTSLHSRHTHLKDRKLYGVLIGPLNLFVFLVNSVTSGTLLRAISTMTSIRFVTGKSSGILSDISSGIVSGISSGILSGILPGISSGTLSGISSGISSAKCSGISSGILSGR